MLICALLHKWISNNRNKEADHELINTNIIILRHTSNIFRYCITLLSCKANQNDYSPIPHCYYVLPWKLQFCAALVLCFTLTTSILCWIISMFTLKASILCCIVTLFVFVLLKPTWKYTTINGMDQVAMQKMAFSEVRRRAASSGF